MAPFPVKDAPRGRCWKIHPNATKPGLLNRLIMSFQASRTLWQQIPRFRRKRIAEKLLNLANNNTKTSKVIVKQSSV
jgi:hypothetical protein